jgi:hypothetical protein
MSYNIISARIKLNLNSILLTLNANLIINCVVFKSLDYTRVKCGIRKECTNPCQYFTNEDVSLCKTGYHHFFFYLYLQSKHNMNLIWRFLCRRHGSEL